MSLFSLIRTANHNLLRNKARTFLTILAIFVGSFTIILSSAIHSGVSGFIDEQTSALGGEDFLMIMPEKSQQMASSMFDSSEPEEYSEQNTVDAQAFSDKDLDTLKKIDGINADSFFSPAPLTGSGYFASKKTDKRYTIKNATILPPGNFQIPLVSGNLPDDSSDKSQIVLDPGYAVALGFDSDEDIIGETITVAFKNPITKKTAEFSAEVTGVKAPGLMTSTEGAYLSHALYDKIYDFTTEYYPDDYEAPTYYVMATYDTSRFSEEEIKQKLSDAGFVAMSTADMMGMIRSFFDVILAVFTIFGSIALLAAAIGIVNTLLMSVEERTREIGLDKALGMSSGKIFLSFSIEAVALGFWGSALGVLVAMAIGFTVNSFVHAPGGLLVDFPTFQLFSFSPQTVLPVVLAVMLIAFIAGTAPAWKAAHKNPIDALRYE